MHYYIDVCGIYASLYLFVARSFQTRFILAILFDTQKVMDNATIKESCFGVRLTRIAIFFGLPKGKMIGNKK